MNIFDQYGIKEVADVTIYSIHKKEDGSGDVYYVPALYLDTLKVTTVEKTAENTWAQGGLGNARLISWDYGKVINLTLEDALCTPASLGLCWGGILGADWKGREINHQTGLNNSCGMERISRMEKAFYPRNNPQYSLIGRLIPHKKSDENDLSTWDSGGVILDKSSIISGTTVKGYGFVDGKTYPWHLKINTTTKQIIFVPEKIFDVDGNIYSLHNNDDFALIPTLNSGYEYSAEYRYDRTVNSTTNVYKIQVDICYNGIAKISVTDRSQGLNPEDDPEFNVNQFYRIPVAVQFNGINEMAYYLLTKYEDNIYSIPEDDTQSLPECAKDKSGTSIWAYVNPKTMAPYDDDYWFRQGEPYYKKSLSISTKDTPLDMQKIFVEQGTFPGMYKIVCETVIRERTTQEDERVQISLPMCKIKSDQTLTLEAEGEPVTFNLDVEVATPPNGIPMEITFYNTEKEKMKCPINGQMVPTDGSTYVALK